MCGRSKCQLYKDAVEKIQSADNLVEVNFLIIDLKELLRMAEKKRDELDLKHQIESIRSRIKTDNTGFSDIVTLLKIIDQKLPEYAPVKAVSDV